MSSYLFMVANCFACRGMFVCNPELVPTVVIEERREPICQACVDKANPLRIARGLEPIRVLPGAYGIRASEDSDLHGERYPDMPCSPDGEEP